MSHVDEIHESTLDEIDRKINEVKGNESDHPNQEALLQELNEDKSTLGAHWKTKSKLVAATQGDGSATPTYSAECKEAQPCSHVVSLAKKYGVADSAGA